MNYTDQQLWDLLQRIQQKVDDIPARLAIAGYQVRVTDLSQINSNLGLVMAGEFRVGNGKDPGKGFTGGRYGWPQFWYGGKQYFWVGVNNDTLEVGANALDGRLYAGGGSVIIGSDGIATYGSTYDRTYHKFYANESTGNDYLVGHIVGYKSTATQARFDIIVERAATDPFTKNLLILSALDGANLGQYPYIALDTEDTIQMRFYSQWLYPGWQGCAAPTAAAVAGGSIDAGEHRYAVTLVDARGRETAIENVASIVISAPNQTVNLTAVPIGPSTYTAKRRIYRTPAGSSDWYKLVGEIANNTATTFTDNIADSSLGAYAPTANRGGFINFGESGEVMSNSLRVSPDIYNFPPKQPTVALVATGTGNVNNGTHSYFVTFVGNGGGESSVSPKSNVVTVDDTHKQVTIPLEIGPYGTTARKIYRSTVGDVGPHKLLATVSDNTTASYTDNIADANLTTTRPSKNTEGRSAFPGIVTFMGEDMNWSTAMTEVPDYAQSYNVFWQQTSPALGDYGRVPIYCEAGTYTLSLRLFSSSDCGLVQTYLDNVAQGSPIDCYAASDTHNAIQTVTVSVTYPGYHVLELKVSGAGTGAGLYFKFTRGQLKRSLA